MEGLLAILSLAFVGQAIRTSVPYALAALGGTVSELSGVVNIGLEGMILTGAFGAVLGQHLTGSGWLGLAAAMVGGAGMALIHGVVVIRFRANQIISGLAINLLAVGLCKFFLKTVFHSSSNSSRVEGLPSLLPDDLFDTPIVHDLLGGPLVLMTLLLFVGLHQVLYRTPFGLRIRAVGEHPAAAQSLGVAVARVRYAAVAISGALAGLGGAWLAFEQHQFSDDISGGRGYIALAAMILGRWTPLGAALAAMLFGFAETLQIQMQTVGIQVPTQFIQMIPYVVTLLVLAGGIRSRAPAASGVPYPPPGG